MIYTLAGTIKHKGLTEIVIDVAGVGYGLELPSTFYSLLPGCGKNCFLWVYTRVKEDELKLYGFLAKNQRDIFEILLEISGIGPKIALAILSFLSVTTMVHAIELKDADVFEEVPGIGKRSAEKIVIELQSKLKKIRLLEISVVSNKEKNSKNIL